MDKDAEIKKLVDERDFVRGWLDHPITKSVFAESDDMQEQLVELICNRTVNSLETLFGHFEAIGDLRGIRRFKSCVQGKLADIDTEIKNLTE